MRVKFDRNLQITEIINNIKLEFPIIPLSQLALYHFDEQHWQWSVKLWWSNFVWQPLNERHLFSYLFYHLLKEENLFLDNTLYSWYTWVKRICIHNLSKYIPNIFCIYIFRSLMPSITVFFQIFDKRMVCPSIFMPKINNTTRNDR